jgi:hypothetical protein
MMLSFAMRILKTNHSTESGFVRHRAFTLIAGLAVLAATAGCYADAPTSPATSLRSGAASFDESNPPPPPGGFGGDAACIPDPVTGVCPTQPCPVETPSCFIVDISGGIFRNPPSTAGSMTFYSKVGKVVSDGAQLRENGRGSRARRAERLIQWSVAVD